MENFFLIEEIEEPVQGKGGGAVKTVALTLIKDVESPNAIELEEEILPNLPKAPRIRLHVGHNRMVKVAGFSSFLMTLHRYCAEKAIELLVECAKESDLFAALHRMHLDTILKIETF